MPMLLPLEIVADAVWEREMTTAAENELLTGVGAGTPMGGLMRQYWVPALMSSELKADGDPVRLMLLGEKLIAFRDSNGKVGIMDHRCPHRCASLFFGRNEDGGIRCVYHGWKFDADGNCTDMANVPPHQDFKHKVHAKAYKTAELNGLVWVFMGDQQNVPPLPRIEAALMPEDELDLTCFLRECNWLQALEGDIDTSHADFLHGGTRQAQDFAADDIRRFGSIHRDPDYAVADTDCGTMYGAYRPAGAGQQYWRIAHFMMPFWTITPAGPFERHVTARAWVPVDDNHTMAFNLRQRGRLGGRWTPHRRVGGGPLSAEYERLVGPMAARRRCAQRLWHRPCGAGEQHLFRRHGRDASGSDDHGKHGHGQRPHVRTSGAERRDDRTDAAASRACRAGIRQGRYPTARSRRSEPLFRRTRRLLRAACRCGLA
jgi:nitrite reductase/ring-hydroxylating ferredoxin subunit